MTNIRVRRTKAGWRYNCQPCQVRYTTHSWDDAISKAFWHAHTRDHLVAIILKGL